MKQGGPNFISWLPGAGHVVQWCSICRSYGKVRVLWNLLFSTSIVRPYVLKYCPVICSQILSSHMFSTDIDQPYALNKYCPAICSQILFKHMLSPNIVQPHVLNKYFINKCCPVIFSLKTLFSHTFSTNIVQPYVLNKYCSTIWSQQILFNHMF